LFSLKTLAATSRIARRVVRTGVASESTDS